MTDLKEILERYRQTVNNALDKVLPSESMLPNTLHKAMRYSTLNPGKRVRPILVYATGECLGLHLDQLHNQACSVELIHAYSLIHDDLPAMDDDDLRRGIPTCHKKFDEATAILAGDALHALAFQVLSQPLPHISYEIQVKMFYELAIAVGSRGMAGGQAIDLDAVGKQLSLAELENMHIHKTGALIRASVRLGALSLPNIEANILERLDHYAKCIGLAFQIQDDILDVIGDTKTLGKSQGSDIAQNKPTYVSILGLDEAKAHLETLHQEALASLSTIENSQVLAQIANYIVERNY